MNIKKMLGEGGLLCPRLFKWGNHSQIRWLNVGNSPILHNSVFFFPYTLSSPSLSKQAVITLILFVRREPNPSTICAKKVESTPNMFSLNNTQRRNRFGLYLTCRNLNLIKFSVLFFFLQQEGGSPGGSPPCDNHFTSPP